MFLDWCPEGRSCGLHKYTPHIGLAAELKHAPPLLPNSTKTATAILPRGNYSRLSKSKGDLHYNASSSSCPETIWSREVDHFHCEMESQLQAAEENIEERARTCRLLCLGADDISAQHISAMPEDDPCTVVTRV